MDGVPRCPSRSAQQLFLQRSQADAPVLSHFLDVLLRGHHGAVTHGAGISDTRSGRKWPNSCAASHSDDSSPHTKKAE
eukprot:4729421-Prymnesium_polylepis.1